jgi:PilZ domain
MTPERREHFRIRDKVLLRYRVLAEEAVEEERREVLMHASRTETLAAGLRGIDRRLSTLMLNIRRRDAAVGEALDLLDHKLALIARLIAVDVQRPQADNYADHCLTAVSISGGGMAFSAPSPLQKDLQLALSVVLVPIEHAMRMIGRVIDCKSDQNGHLIAVAFTALREDDREQLIAHLLRTEAALRCGSLLALETV